MESKLTLRLNSGAIRRARNYIKVHEVKNLSRLVEKYFNSLVLADYDHEEKQLPPIVAGLAGIAGKPQSEKVRQTYTEYLIEKYR